MPIRCPICNDVMTTDYVIHADKTQTLKKVCYKRPNHRISFFSLVKDHDSVDKMYWRYTNNTEVEWRIADETARFYGVESSLSLPFFEPDFSDVSRLKQKVKTYILFS